MNLKELWQGDENQSIKGWDFSHIKDRWYEEVLPFDYKKIVMKYLKKDMTLLDMGTGGGEFLLSLNHPHQNTYATEGYKPNYDYCLEQLQPLGITVKYIDKSGVIPFDDATFDIIINKHSNYNIKEVKRVLKKGGLFITQQIGCYNNRELSQVFIEGFELPDKHKHLNIQSSRFIEEEFKILECDEYFPEIRFYDIGALVFFCKIIVWEFPGFSVNKYYNKLRKLHSICQRNGYITSKEHRFLLVCKSK